MAGLASRLRSRLMRPAMASIPRMRRPCPAGSLLYVGRLSLRGRPPCHAQRCQRRAWFRIACQGPRYQSAEWRRAVTRHQGTAVPSVRSSPSTLPPWHPVSHSRVAIQGWTATPRYQSPGPLGPWSVPRLPCYRTGSGITRPGVGWFSHKRRPTATGFDVTVSASPFPVPLLGWETSGGSAVTRVCDLQARS